ncbi:MAG: CoA-binding protein [Chloroflexota bacterium]
MEPRSIAVVGVTRETGPTAFNIVQHLRNKGYQGQVFPVHPALETLLGLKAYPSVDALPAGIDLAVVSTPRNTVPVLLEKCAARGIKAAVVIAQGFADADDEGKRLQAEIARVVQQTGLRVMGPNTFGVANAFLNLSTALPPLPLGRSPIAIICQTGFFFVGLARTCFGKVIDLGNACDVDFADSLEYLEHDPDIKVIALHIEGLRGGKRFFEVARRVANKKPLVALKTGRSERGARAAASHTGSMAGRYQAYAAAFRQAGIVQVEDVEELEDVCQAFVRLPPLRGKRLGVTSWAGSTAVMSVDACEKHGIGLRASPRSRPPKCAVWEHQRGCRQKTLLTYGVTLVWLLSTPASSNRA